MRKETHETQRNGTAVPYVLVADYLPERAIAKISIVSFAEGLLDNAV